MKTYTERTKTHRAEKVTRENVARLAAMVPGATALADGGEFYPSTGGARTIGPAIVLPSEKTVGIGDYLAQIGDGRYYGVKGEDHERLYVEVDQ